MPTLDCASFPHIFDAVVDHLLATQQDRSLRAVASASHSTRSVVYQKCTQHMVIDYRVTPAEIRTSVGQFRSLEHQSHAEAVPKVLDVHGRPDYARAESLSTVEEGFKRNPPQIIRLLDHYGLEEALQCKKPVDTVIFQTKNWYPKDQVEPGPWFLLFPPYAKRIVVNVIGCTGFGYPDLAFGPGHAEEDLEQELVYIVTWDPGSPPKSVDAVTVNQHHIIDSAAHCILGLLAQFPRYTAVVVGTDSWRPEWTQLQLTEEESVLPIAELGQALFIRSLAATQQNLFTAETEHYLRRIEFVSREDYKGRVGEGMFELISIEH